MWRRKQNPALVAGLALVGVAAVAALVLARPEPIPRELVPPPRSVVASQPEGASTEATAADPAAELETPEEPPSGYALTRQDFENVITHVRNQALGCKDDSSPPSMVVKLSIAPTGQVASVGVPQELRGTHTGECVARAMRGAVFPAYRFPPVPAVEWLYTLRFSGSD